MLRPYPAAKSNTEPTPAHPPKRHSATFSHQPRRSIMPSRKYAIAAVDTDADLPQAEREHVVVTIDVERRITRHRVADGDQLPNGLNRRIGRR